MIYFFANIGTRLGRANRNFPHHSDRIGCSVPSVTDITVCEDSVRPNLRAIKPNKSGGPDDIALKLLKLAEPSIVFPLTGLFSFCFVNKLNLLKRSSFLSRNALLDLYFKIILPSVLYGLVVWGGYPNAELLHSLEVLHRRANRIIYNLPRDIPTEEVYRQSNWNTLTLYYKLQLIKLLHSVFIGEAPTALHT